MSHTQERKAPHDIENPPLVGDSKLARVFSAGIPSPATDLDWHHDHRAGPADQSVRAAGQPGWDVSAIDGAVSARAHADGPTDAASSTGVAAVRLADGRPGVIRPLQPSDEQPLCSVACDRSEESLYRRFFSAGEQHFDMLARRRRAEANFGATALVLEIAGQVVGVATAEDLRAGAVTAAYLLEDATRRHRIGTLLLGNLAVGERRHSVAGLRAAGLGDNVCMLRVFIRAGYTVVRHHRGGAAAVQLTTMSAIAPAVPRQRQQPAQHSVGRW